MFQKNKNLIIIIALSVIFFGVYAWPYFSLRPAAVGNDMWIFNTPDETANYFFIDKLARDGELTQAEPLNQISELNLVHPRGTTVVDDKIAPGSFLGFVIFEGAIGKILGANWIFLIIPFFSIFAVVAFYFLLKNFFEEKIAFFSSILFLALPAFWYYNSRSLFNNALFVDFIIIGFCCLFRFAKNKTILSLISAGLLIGLALSFRTTEAVWVGLLVLIFFGLKLEKKSFFYFLVFGFFALLAFAPILFFQFQVFGNAFTTGYAPELAQKTGQAGVLAKYFKTLFLPFGFNFQNIVANLYHYFISMFWWYFWPAVLGVLAVFFGGPKSREKKYLLVAGLVSFFILLYYGSWEFTNNLMAKPLIGSSQARYFLPIYILALPLAVYLVAWLIDFLKNKKARIGLALVFLILAFYLSFNAVWLKGEESLASVMATVKKYHAINKEVRQITPENSVIVSSYNDKVFFPKRKVIFYWQRPEFLADIEKISSQAPIYFYSIDAGSEGNYITDNSNLHLELVKKIDGLEELYKVVK